MILIDVSAMKKMISLSVAGQNACEKCLNTYFPDCIIEFSKMSVCKDMPEAAKNDQCEKVIDHNPGNLDYNAILAFEALLLLGRDGYSGNYREYGSADDANEPMDNNDDEAEGNNHQAEDFDSQSEDSDDERKKTAVSFEELLQNEQSGLLKNV